MPKRNPIKTGITRRQFLGAASITGISAFLSGVMSGTKQRNASSLAKSGETQKIKNLALIEPEEKIGNRLHVAEMHNNQKFTVFRPGLKGEEFTRAYGVQFTRSAFDLKTVPQALVNDIKILVAQECRKYNSQGELVDPHEILATIEHESRYNPNATGTKGDAGLGQLMPSQIETLKKLPELSVAITDPYDPMQNIAGIVRTFVWLKQHPPNKEYQTPYRRWAAYNRGRGTANSLGDLSGNRYANKVLAIWNRLKAENAFKGYM